MRIVHGFALIAALLGAYLAGLAWAAGETGLKPLLWPVVLVSAVYLAALGVVAQYAPQYWVRAWRGLMARLGR